MAASLVAIDWGTSSFRAWRLAADGTIRDTRHADSGIIRVEGGKFAATLLRHAGDWIDGATVIMCGMIGSRQGWVEAPYAPCPAGTAELAAQLVAVTAAPVRTLIVPGVSVRHANGVPDVMRGEETQLAGCDEATGLFVLPGTHSKWVWREDGRIVWFKTFMTGELFDLLCRHSLLARGMAGDGIDPDGFAEGLAHAADATGSLGTLFGVRSRGLFGELAPEAARGYLSGLLIGAEVREAKAALVAKGINATKACVIGSAALGSVYLQALARAGLAGHVLDETSAARGLYRIACAANLLTE